VADEHGTARHLEFVDTLPAQARRTSKWTDIRAELAGRPGEWARIYAGGGYPRQRLAALGCEVRTVTVDGEKQTYARWNPDAITPKRGHSDDHLLYLSAPAPEGTPKAWYVVLDHGGGDLDYWAFATEDEAHHFAKDRASVIGIPAAPAPEETP